MSRSSPDYYYVYRVHDAEWRIYEPKQIIMLWLTNNHYLKSKSTITVIFIKSDVLSRNLR